MGHESRIWFVECLTNFTHTFLVTNIDSGADENSARDGVDVWIGGRAVRKKLVQVSHADILMLKKHKKQFNLEFNVFMAESRGAKITPWVM